jgi:23S rRNA pseudouridine1911/1915/1917 synthase
LEWIIDDQHEGLLVREYLNNVRAFSHRLIKSIKREGTIKVNGEEVTVRKVLHAGDQLVIEFPEEQKGRELTSLPIPLEIVYEDKDVLVLNKQAGIPVVPSRHHEEGSIASGILNHYEHQGLSYTVHIVTRLDKNTSGLMLVAKHRLSHSLLSEQQQVGQVKRAYAAYVTGPVSLIKGTIDQPIGRKVHSIIEREVRPDGKHAVTHYQVKEQYEHFTHVHIRLETGRTHQIRVHFSYIGHPLLGDDLYGGRQDVMKRQALHCRYLSFWHPFQNKWLEFTIDLPQDMTELLP